MLYKDGIRSLCIFFYIRTHTYIYKKVFAVWCGIPSVISQFNFIKFKGAMLIYTGWRSGFVCFYLGEDAIKINKQSLSGLVKI